MYRDKYAFVGLGRTATQRLVPRDLFIFFTLSPTYGWLVYSITPCAEKHCHFFSPFFLLHT